MGDLWQEVPKDEYWDTFCGIVDIKGKGSGDIFLLTVDYLIKHESIYFYTLGGKVYIQTPETELSEVEYMRFKKEKNKEKKKKILKINYHSEHRSYYSDKSFYYEHNIILEQTCTKVPRTYSVGYDCKYYLTVDGNKVEIKRIGIKFPEEFKKKRINLE